MIAFVNAKLNLGLSVTRKREDGYHDLETLFYPVGIYNGTPANPSPFCDVLEIIKTGTDQEDAFKVIGNEIECSDKDNLIIKALELFRGECIQVGLKGSSYKITLDKHLPSGAGLGGGSGDAAFTLRLLNELEGNPFDKGKLLKLALSLGADCPFFIENRPIFAGGVGECFEEVELDLSGWWALIVKPPVFVSTKEAFSGIQPKAASFDLRNLDKLPIEEWKNHVVNDFETTVFALYPELGEIKAKLYEEGAVYASMSGSGSSLYGLFPDRIAAEKAVCRFKGEVYLCLL